MFVRITGKNTKKVALNRVNTGTNKTFAFANVRNANTFGFAVAA